MNDMRSRGFGRRGENGSPLVQSKTPSGANSEDGLHSVEVPRTATRTNDGRDADRHRLPDESICVKHKRKRHQVQLINLSGGGAMVSGEGFSPKLWDKVQLQLGDTGNVDCVVRWLKEDRIGLEFAHETQIDCSPDQLAQILKDVIARNFPDNAPVEVKVAEPPEQPVASKTDAESAEAAAAGKEHRSDRRHPLIWSGEIHFDYESTPVRLRNISTAGALIECSRAIPIGAEPLLDLREAGSVFATVAWVCGDQIGLTFAQPFDLSLLSRAKPEIAPARWVRPSYLNDAEAPASPWDAHWNRMSVGELNDELDGFLKR